MTTREKRAAVEERWLDWMALDELDGRRAPSNPKLHDLDGIGASMRRRGVVEVPALDERTGKLVAGHGRIDSLLQVRREGGDIPDGVRAGDDGRWYAPVLRGWRSSDDDDAAQYLVGSNQLTMAPGWDEEALAAMLKGWDADDLLGTGFDTDSVQELFHRVRGHNRRNGTGDPDDAPEPPQVPVTQPGDLWVLGDHRVLCGDARDVDDYRRLMGDRPADMVVTDPPYGVGIGAKNRALDAIDRAGPLLTDIDGDQGIDEVESLWRASFAVLQKVISNGCPYYVFGPQGGDLGLLLLLLLRDAGLSPRHILIWAKNRPSFSIGRLDYDYQHEPIVYGWKPGAAHPWYAPEPQQSLLFVDRPQASPLHPTMKPVELLRVLLRNSSRLGGCVLDPFGGSGSTLIAAEEEGRHARLLELSRHYCDVICRRWQDLTGGTPVNAATGDPVRFAWPSSDDRT